MILGLFLWTVCHTYGLSRHTGDEKRRDAKIIKNVCIIYIYIQNNIGTVAFASKTIEYYQSMTVEIASSFNPVCAVGLVETVFSNNLVYTLP